MRMAGVNIGKVKSKELGPGGRTTWSRWRSTTASRRSAATRARSCARRACSARPTWRSPRAARRGKELDDGGTLARTNVDDTVELDEVFRVFDPETREGFQQWLHEAGIVTSGTFARDFNDSLGNAAPFFEGGARPAAAARRAGGRAAAGVPRHRPRLRRRLARGRPAARPDHGRRGDLRRARLARRRARRDVPGLPDLPARDARHRCCGSRTSPATPTRWCATCASLRRTSRRRCATSATSRRTSRSSSATSTRSCAASETRRARRPSAS